MLKKGQMLTALNLNNAYLSKTNLASQTVLGPVSFSAGVSMTSLTLSSFLTVSSNLTVHGTGTSSFSGSVSIDNVLTANTLSFSSLSSSSKVPWANLSNSPSSTVLEIDDTVSKKHTQNTDSGTSVSMFEVCSGGTGPGGIVLYSPSGPYIRWSGTQWEFYSTWGNVKSFGAIKASSFKRADGTEVSYANHTHPQMHDAVTVNGNGLSLDGQQISLIFGTTSTTVSAGHNHPYLSNSHAASGVTSSLISNWNNAYSHSTTAHAPSDAPSNAAFTSHVGDTSIHKSWGNWSTNGSQDLLVHKKRALVGYTTETRDKLFINYEKDFLNGVQINGEVTFTDNIVMTSGKTINGRNISEDGMVLDSLSSVNVCRKRGAVKLTNPITQDVAVTLTGIGISDVTWAETSIVLVNVDGRLNAEDVGTVQFDYLRSGTQSIKFHYDIPKDSILEVIVL